MPFSVAKSQKKNLAMGRRMLSTQNLKFREAQFNLIDLEFLFARSVEHLLKLS